MKNNATALILIAAAAAIFLFNRPAKAAENIPTIADINASVNLSELEAWYNLIGELYITGVINGAEYDSLYAAYVARYTELSGV